MLLVRYVSVGFRGCSCRGLAQFLTYGDPLRQHRLEANTGEVRANRNADYRDYRVAALRGDRSSDDGSALVAAAVSSACRSAIHSPAEAAAACRRKRLGGDAA
jgi:hypothetical protein